MFMLAFGHVQIEDRFFKKCFICLGNNYEEKNLKIEGSQTKQEFTLNENMVEQKA